MLDSWRHGATLPPKMNRVSLFAKLAVLCPLIGLGSCSKKSGDDARNAESPDQAESAAINPAEAGPSKPGHLPATKSEDRTRTESEQRVKSFTRHLDQLEVQRKESSSREQERRIALNKLRGVPDNTPVDITHPGVARDSMIEGEAAAFDAYLMSAYELQTLEAKEKLATEQLQRLRESNDRDQTGGLENNRQ